MSPHLVVAGYAALLFAAIAGVMTVWCFRLLRRNWEMDLELRIAQQEIRFLGDELAACDAMFRALAGVESWQHQDAPLTVADIVGDDDERA